MKVCGDEICEIFAIVLLHFVRSWWQRGGLRVVMCFEVRKSFLIGT
jgi:hypothetical protein